MKMPGGRDTTGAAFLLTSFRALDMDGNDRLRRAAFRPQPKIADGSPSHALPSFTSYPNLWALDPNDARPQD